MIKKLYTMNIDNYLPELCKITMPTIEAYAHKIGAELIIITERQFPDWPITYEKIQLYNLAKDNDWTIFVDADTVIGKDVPDFTELLKYYHIGVYMTYDADITLPSEYFMIEDRRNIGIVTSFMVVHKDCHKIWTPLTESIQSALRRLRCVNARPHIIDEFCISRNLARYKFDFRGLIEINDQFLHLSAISEDNNTLKRAKDFACLYTT